MGKPSETGSTEDLELFFFEATIEEGDMWDLQPATSPLDATKFYTLDI